MKISHTGKEPAFEELMQLHPTGNIAAPVNAESDVRRVLLVDDESSIVDLFSMILRNAGYFVRTALNGAAGLSLFQGAAWDLVITDRQMPQMDGERLAEAIKGIAPATPLILITGIAGNPRSGLFEAVLRKPFSKATLLASIQDVLLEDAALSRQA